MIDILTYKMSDLVYQACSQDGCEAWQKDNPTKKCVWADWNLLQIGLLEKGGAKPQVRNFKFRFSRKWLWLTLPFLVVILYMFYLLFDKDLFYFSVVIWALAMGIMIGDSF